MSFISKVVKGFKTPTGLKIAGITALVAVTAGLGLATGNKTANAQVSRDCSANSILKCGALTPGEFINDVRADKPNGDLQVVYRNFGLVSSDYGRFASTAKMGSDERNGNIVVDGQVVATNAWSIGREPIAGTTRYHIPGDSGTFYRGPNNITYASGVQSIPVMVMFDSKGVMQFAVMTACGNPAPGSKVTPSYSCNELKSTHVSGNTYSFSTDASADHNAKIVKVVYDFGDGSATVTKSSPSDVVTHTFTKTSTVTVKVYVSVPGNQTVVVESSKCSKQITVTPPPSAKLVCVNLDVQAGQMDKNNDVTYSLNASASATNGATINSYTFDFGDGSNKTVNTSANSTKLSHTYAPGDYTATVTVNGTANGKTVSVTSDNCSKQINVKTPPPSASIICVNLEDTPGQADSQGNIPYQFNAQANATNGATISSYAFDFGDGQSQTVTTNAETAATSHTYAPGDYTATVTVNGTANGKTVSETSDSCSVKISVPTPPQTCTTASGQTYPAGSPECQPQPTCTSPSGQTYPAGSPECTPSTTLPNTGPGDVAGLFSGVSLSGAGAHRLLMNRRARKATRK